MARTTLALARAELAAFFGSTDGIPVATLIAAGCRQVAAFEPKPGELAKPCALSVSSAGMDADYFQMNVRVYVTGDVDSQLMQDTLDAVVNVADDLPGDGWGRSTWKFGWVPDLGCMVATSVLECGRDGVY